MVSPPIEHDPAVTTKVSIVQVMGMGTLPTNRAYASVVNGCFVGSSKPVWITCLNRLRGPGQISECHGDQQKYRDKCARRQFLACCAFFACQLGSAASTHSVGLLVEPGRPLFAAAGAPSSGLWAPVAKLVTAPALQAGD